MATLSGSEVNILLKTTLEGEAAYAEQAGLLKAVQEEAGRTSISLDGVAKSSGLTAGEVERMAPGLARLQSDLADARDRADEMGVRLRDAGVGANAADAATSRLFSTLARRSVLADVAADLDLTARQANAVAAALVSATAAADRAAAAGGAGGGAGIGASLMALLGFGGGGGGFALGGLAVPGAAGLSLGAMAGLGPEHIVTTGLGIAGSLAGGLAGGGLLAAGAAGVAGVGMGSDAAVMKSTIADTHQLGQNYATLTQAVRDFGANSTQASAATAALNATVANLGNTAGVQAELGLAKAAAALNALWDQSSSGARVAAVAILDQVVGLATTYVPKVTAAAQENLGIINNAIKPLFTWLQSDGMVIFDHLETRFRDNLPTATHAFSQGIELVIKIIDQAAIYTGGFIDLVDRLLTSLNSPAGFEKVSTTVEHLVGLFENWVQFFKALGDTVVIVFGQSLGLGESIAQALTSLLDRLNSYLSSVQGKAQLQSVFSTHKDEIMAIISLIPILVNALGPVYLTLSPALTTVATDILTVVADVAIWLEQLGGNGGLISTIDTWAIGLTLIQLKTGLVGDAIGLVTGLGRGAIDVFVGLRDAFTGAALAEEASTAQLVAFKIATIAQTAATAVATAAQWLWNVAMDANPIGLVIIAIAALIAVIVLLVTHWNLVVTTLTNVFGWLNQVIQSHTWLKVVIDDLFAPLELLISHWGGVVSVTKDVVNWFGHAGDAFSALGSAAQKIGDLIGSTFSALGTNVTTSLTDIARKIDDFDAAVDKLPGLSGFLPTNIGGAGLAAGGVIAHAAIVGEDGSGYPEYVIPTNPAHRGNALTLTGALLSNLGMMAGGGILGGLLDPIVNAAHSAMTGLGPMGGLGVAIVDAIAQSVTGRLDSLTAGSVSSAPAAWVGWILQAIQQTGVPASWLSGLEIIARYESGFSNTAVNLTDINAQRGDPSVGAFQLTLSNQARFGGVTSDPVMQAVEAIRYILSTYTDISRVPGVASVAAGGPYLPYDSGGWLLPGGKAINTSGRPEYVLNPQQTAAMATGNTYIINAPLGGITAETVADIQRQADWHARTRTV
jgi:hypothetical protein